MSAAATLYDALEQSEKYLHTANRKIRSEMLKISLTKSNELFVMMPERRYKNKVFRTFGQLLDRKAVSSVSKWGK